MKSETARHWSCAVSLAETALLRAADASFVSISDNPQTAICVPSDMERRRGCAPAAVIFVALMSACGPGEVGSTEPAPIKTASPAPDRSPDPSPSPEGGVVEQLARPVSIPNLPEQGFAINERNRVLLVAVDGQQLATLHGFTVAGRTRDGAGVWLRRRPQIFRLEPGADELEPVPRATWRHNTYVEKPPRDLPPPEGARRKNRISGHWRYVLRSPVSDALLAQWSDECEVPSAHFIYPGSAPVNVMGPGHWWRHPSSHALGWTSDGVALVFLPIGACSGGTDPPGIYAFTEPGDSRLIFETKGYPTVTMWGDASEAS